MLGAERQAVRCTYPPTAKNTGITCSSQVAIQPPGTLSIGFGISSRPSRQYSSDSVVCQTTTTATAPIRTRSTTRSRSSGVAAASARTVPPGRRSDRADPEDATPPACAIPQCDAIRCRDATGCRATPPLESSCLYPSFTSPVRDGSRQVDELGGHPPFE